MALSIRRDATMTGGAGPEQSRAHAFAGSWALLLSLGVHVGLASLVWVLHSAAGQTGEAWIDVEFAETGGSPQDGQQSAGRARAEPSHRLPEGGPDLSRPDLESSEGGGAEGASERAVNLAAHIDRQTRNDVIPDTLQTQQVDRLRTSHLRRTRHDRRRTLHPMELSLVATGHGPAVMRLDDGPFGSHAVERRAQRRAGSPNSNSGPEGKLSAQTGMARIDSRERAKWRRRARIALARPAVPRASADVTATRRARPSDDMNSDAQVALAIHSMIRASSNGGAQPGSERGAGSGRELGTGGAGRGSASRPSHGFGKGSYVAQPDARYTDYFRRVREHLDPYWQDAFPLQAAYEGRSGLAIFNLILRRDGSIDRVRLLRRSGIPEFDQNLAAAVQRAAPFPPMPAELGPGPTSFVITFDQVTPAVSPPP